MKQGRCTHTSSTSGTATDSRFWPTAGNNRQTAQNLVARVMTSGAAPSFSLWVYNFASNRRKFASTQTAFSGK
jgi:hypothetical protein